VDKLPSRRVYHVRKNNRFCFYISLVLLENVNYDLFASRTQLLILLVYVAEVLKILDWKENRELGRVVLVDLYSQLLVFYVATQRVALA